jgi:hypothetical protein
MGIFEIQSNFFTSEKSVLPLTQFSFSCWQIVRSEALHYQGMILSQNPDRVGISPTLAKITKSSRNDATP